MAVNIERVETGIPGLDKLIEGGYVKNSVNLIAGTTGTGKTIFCCQFLLEGARRGEPGIYISLEQTDESILEDLSVFSWGEEFKKYVDEQVITMESKPPTDFKELSDVAFNLIKRNNAKRFVLDSLSLAGMGWKISTMDIGKIRRETFDFISALKKAGVTSLLVNEVSEAEGKTLSRFGFEEFVADSVIVIHYLEYAAAGIPRSLLLRKMRRTAHKTDIFPMEIGRDGIKVLPAKKGVVI